MLKNNWTARTAWTAQKVKNVCTEFADAAKPRSREAANIKFLQNADKFTIYIMPSHFVNYGTRTNGGVRAAKLL